MISEYKSVQPSDYYKTFSDLKIRPDGRELLESRFASINVGSISTADGSALVRIGNSAVICGIKSELAVPKATAPDAGFIVPNLDLSPLCAAHFRPGPPGRQAQVTSQLIMEIIESSRLIDLKKLCIKEGKVVWVLYCDIVCLNYDGSVLDASCIALLAALKDLKLPHVMVNPETDTPTVDLGTKSRIELNSYPIAVTFSLFEDKLLIDPTYEEEQLANCLITICSVGDRLCGVYKHGGLGTQEAQFQQCISQANTRRKDVLKMIEGAFELLTK